ncbi:PREDICTED: C-C motif chemokine 3 [Chinchilla lanigera]|uniref:C-C motif chemokine n=1 Tax=Chinchilla lanigera TaxID=34839 RepID=A0A8C2V5S2_CHILA|nr:PREDICTED: C-C motif chemokine 3 [Chinchilla lanigera]
MKALMIALLVLPCTVMLHSHEKDKAHLPSECCFSFISRQIPRNRVVYYYKTDSTCSMDAVIFLTKKGRHICANPSDPWVQDYIRDLEGSS